MHDWEIVAINEPIAVRNIYIAGVTGSVPVGGGWEEWCSTLLALTNITPPAMN